MKSSISTSGLRLIVKSLALASTSLLAVSNASAAVVLIDWSRAAVVTNPAGDGKHWNSVGALNVGNVAQPLATTALIDSTGAASGISVAVGFGTSTTNNTATGSGFGGTGIAGPIGVDPFDETNAVNDGIYVNSNTFGGGDSTATITFTGLLASTQYDISAIGGRASNGIDGLLAVTTGTAGASPYTLANNGAILNFLVTSNGTGSIVLNFSTTATGGGINSVFKAMSINAVPEPATAMLGGLGCLVLGLRRRRL
jgi:hypothetical protein